MQLNSSSWLFCIILLSILILYQYQLVPSFTEIKLVDVFPVATKHHENPQPIQGAKAVYFMGIFNDSNKGTNTWTAQKGQDKWVQSVLGNKTNGFFVELAANRPMRHSSTYFLEKEFSWNGLCIEGNPNYFWPLAMNRTCTVVAAVVDETFSDAKFRIDNGGGGGIVAEDTDNNERKRSKQIAAGTILSLPSVPFTDILDRMNAPTVIDYLSFDIEGAETRVLRRFDFKKYTFMTMSVERPTPELNNVLKLNGYIYVKSLPDDCVVKKCSESLYVHSSIPNLADIKVEAFKQVPPKNW